MQTLDFTCYSEDCKQLDLFYCSSGGGELFVTVTWEQLKGAIKSTWKPLFNRCASFCSSDTFTNRDLALCNHLKWRLCYWINFIGIVVNYLSSNECKIANLRKLKSFVKANQVPNKRQCSMGLLSRLRLYSNRLRFGDRPSRAQELHCWAVLSREPTCMLQGAWPSGINIGHILLCRKYLQNFYYNSNITCE